MSWRVSLVWQSMLSQVTLSLMLLMASLLFFYREQPPEQTQRENAVWTLRAAALRPDGQTVIFVYEAR